MAHDLDKPYEYPFEVATEEEIKFQKGAIEAVSYTHLTLPTKA